MPFFSSSVPKRHPTPKRAFQARLVPADDGMSAGLFSDTGS